jgi:hypothetical protein
MNPTKNYIKEHRFIFSLKKKIIRQSVPSNLIGWSILRLLKHHAKLFVICILHFPVEFFKYRHFLYKTWKLGGSAKKKRALIIGNGPSQGYLKKIELDKFVETGGETYCVNFWNSNKSLRSHVPTWMVFSDEYHLFGKNFKSINLIKYLRGNPSINIIIPTYHIKLARELKLPNKIYAIIDYELSIWRNINPLFPRGYLSMTLYKALAWATYLNYHSIGLIGMDNTYPRKIYNDKKNCLIAMETNAGNKDWLNNLSLLYSNVAAYVDDLTRLFYHLEYFPKKKIFNLDPYSLTDRFKKVTKDSFFRKASVKK